MFGHLESNLVNTLRPIQTFSPRIYGRRYTVGFLQKTSRLLRFLFIVWVAYGSTISVLAQEPTWRVREGLPVGSEAEKYLRVLQVAGKAPFHVWTLRGFAPQALVGVLPRSGAHPWQDRMDFNPEPATGLRLGWIQPRVGLTSNSAYPFGENDGSVWAGRGLTAVAEAGGFLRLGRLHLRLAPEGFWAENGRFDVADNGYSAAGLHWDDTKPGEIDRPQRFGEAGYARLGFGSSAIHLTLPGITVGVSGAGQHWGPTHHYPLLLGNNAGGFLNVFGQTTRPINLWAVRVQARYILGWPSDSDFSPVSTDKGRRLITGAVVALLPRGIDGLELGVARFIHALSPSGNFRKEDAFRVFSGLINDFTTTENRVLENQLASAFFRWVFPGAGVEVYGEVVKEDFARDLRHIIEEPEDLMGRVFGFQKVWSSSGGRLTSFRGEMVNARVHHSERFDRLRAYGQIPMPLYSHGQVRQGHTHAGQLLSTPAAYGGSGWTIGLDLYHPQGRWTIDLSRSLESEFSRIYSGTSGPQISDVIYALKVEAVRFRDGVEWTTTVTPSLNLNRNLVEENDVFNLTLRLSMNGLPW